MYQTDLIMIDGGNPDEINGLINITKYRLMTETIKKIRQYQLTGYSLRVVEDLYQVFLLFFFHVISISSFLSILCVPDIVATVDDPEPLQDDRGHAIRSKLLPRTARWEGAGTQARSPGQLSHGCGEGDERLL